MMRRIPATIYYIKNNQKPKQTPKDKSRVIHSKNWQETGRAGQNAIHTNTVNKTIRSYRVLRANWHFRRWKGASLRNKNYFSTTTQRLLEPAGRKLHLMAYPISSTATSNRQHFNKKSMDITKGCRKYWTLKPMMITTNMNYPAAIYAPELRATN